MFYLQEFEQVLIVNTGEKAFQVSGGGERKRTILKHSVLQKMYTKGNMVNRSLSCWKAISKAPRIFRTKTLQRHILKTEMLSYSSRMLSYSPYKLQYYSKQIILPSISCLTIKNESKKISLIEEAAKEEF